MSLFIIDYYLLIIYKNDQMVRHWTLSLSLNNMNHLILQWY